MRSARLLGELDLHLFNEGRHFELAGAFGAQRSRSTACRGVRFAVWAPNARRCRVVGDFNTWDATAPSDAPALPGRRVGTVRAAHRRRGRATSTTSSARTARACR